MHKSDTVMSDSLFSYHCFVERRETQRPHRQFPRVDIRREQIVCGHPPSWATPL